MERQIQYQAAPMRLCATTVFRAATHRQLALQSAHCAQVGSIRISTGKPHARTVRLATIARSAPHQSYRAKGAATQAPLILRQPISAPIALLARHVPLVRQLTPHAPQGRSARKRIGGNVSRALQASSKTRAGRRRARAAQLATTASRVRLLSCRVHRAPTARLAAWAAHRNA